MNEQLRKAKSFTLTLCFAAIVLIFAVNITKELSQENVVGRAFYRPIQIYGTVEPALPDGTIVSFRIDGIEIASAAINNSMYGYGEKIFFELDDESTLKREGYRERDTVGVYIEDVRIMEFSHFEPGANKKDIKIPTSKRVEVSTKAAKTYAERTCEPFWQCGEWSACINGIQTRSCMDIFECEKDEGKPEEERECEMPPVIEEPGILDMVTLELILSIIAFVILVVISIFLIRRKILEYKVEKYAKEKRIARKKR
jgi:hypothetical protein